MGSRFCLQMPLSKPKERTETNRCESTRMNQEGSNKQFGVLKDEKSNKIRLCRFISSDPSQSRLSSQGAGHQMLAELVKGTKSAVKPRSSFHCFPRTKTAP